jgi:hypothetical protein
MERMTLRQRLRWIADYYLLKGIVVAAGAVLGLFLLKMIMFPGTVPQAQILVITKLRGDYSGVERALSEKLEALDLSDGVSIEYMEENTAFSGTALGVKLASGEFDAVIAEREHFQFLEDAGLLADLDAVSGGKIRNVPEERLVLSSGGDTKKPIVTGIRLAGNGFYSACTEYLVDPVLGVVASPDDPEEERVIVESAL